MKFKVWTELEKEIEAESQDEAERIFEDELKIEDIIINSEEIMTTTQEQIIETEKKLNKLKEKLKQETDKLEYIYIKELGIEIQTKIHHKNKSYDDLVKEFGKEYLEEHLPTYAQLQFLRNSEKYKEILGLIDSWEFVKQEDDISRNNKYVARFLAYSDGAVLFCNGIPFSSDASLGVRFVRKKLNLGEKDATNTN